MHEAGDNFRQLRNIGAHVHRVRQIFSYMPTSSEEDWAAVAGRLRKLPGALDGYRATLTEGISRDGGRIPRSSRWAFQHQARRRPARTPLGDPGCPTG